MFAMFLVLIALLSAVVFSSHLRAPERFRATAVEEPVEDNSHAAHILKFLKQTNQQRFSKIVEEDKHQKKENVLATTQPDVTAGYFITRSRQNGDCSGDVNFEFGERLGLCYEYSGGTRSYKYICKKLQGDTVVFQSQKYESANCAPGTELYKLDLHEVGNKCSFDPDAVTSSGFETESAQCSAVTVPVLKSGLLQTYYKDSQCADTASPAMYGNNLFDQCHMYLDYSASATEGVVDANTRFWYIKLASCSTSGKMLVHMYTDPSCRRAKYKTTVDLPAEDATYNTCTFDDNMGMYTKTICKRS